MDQEEVNKFVFPQKPRAAGACLFGRQTAARFLVFRRCSDISILEHQINEEIRDKEVRLIDSDGSQLGIVSIQQAMAVAAERNLDLVKIAPKAEPPVCRVMDYGKFRYQEQKKAQEMKARQKVVQVKEVKFRPATDENDYQTKLRALRRFLGDGDKAKVTLRYRGREMAHQQLGAQIMDRIRTDLAEEAQIEQNPKMEGRQMIMVLAPKKKK